MCLKGRIHTSKSLDFKYICCNCNLECIILQGSHTRRHLITRNIHYHTLNWPTFCLLSSRRSLNRRLILSQAHTVVVFRSDFILFLMRNNMVSSPVSIFFFKKKHHMPKRGSPRVADENGKYRSFRGIGKSPRNPTPNHLVCTCCADDNEEQRPPVIFCYALTKTGPREQIGINFDRFGSDPRR